MKPPNGFSYKHLPRGNLLIDRDIECGHLAARLEMKIVRRRRLHVSACEDFLRDASARHRRKLVLRLARRPIVQSSADHGDNDDSCDDGDGWCAHGCARMNERIRL